MTGVQTCALPIYTNYASLQAQINLSKSQGALQTSIQRLSSGLRVSSAMDDAAGLAIGDRMTAQINGLNQAGRNANDGISLAQTADGALSSVNGNLQRIRQLAVQSANSTNSGTDRASLNQEAQQLLSEIQRVATSTQFNGLNLLDGSFQGSQFQVGANANQTINVTMQGATTQVLGSYIGAGAVGAGATPANLVNGAAGFDASNFIKINGVTIGATATTNPTTNGLLGLTEGSAYAKASVINAQSSLTGVSAIASTTVTASTAPTTFNSIASGELSINGVAVGSVTAGSNAVSQGQNVAAAINAISAQTGVLAAADSVSGKLTLTAADGRNIAVGDSSVTAAGQVDAETGLTANGVTGAVYTAGAAPTTASTLSLAAGDLTINGVDVGALAINGTGALGNATIVANAINQLTSQTGVVASVGTGNKLALTPQNGAGFVNIGGTAANAAGTLASTGLTVPATQAAVTAGSLSLSSSQNFSVTEGVTGVVGGSQGLAYAGFNNFAESLKSLTSVDLTTVGGANSALSVVDAAIAQIDSQRAVLGATSNRFQATVTNLQTTSASLSSARARILDTDFAAETANLSQSQILQQAGTAMLTQANSLPNSVLTLLKG